jgi:hypothetical protein
VLVGVADAEDVASEAWAQAFRDLDRFSGGADGVSEVGELGEVGEVGVVVSVAFGVLATASVAWSEALPGSVGRSTELARAKPPEVSATTAPVATTARAAARRPSAEGAT